ncbi:MAG: thiamine phosphate synthase [Chitinivibrionales bacterium]|nr:thiamine phosphate synthase [Chitinivibrionales bacterium]MBD3394672.1 thiamine phosphate synthase [Chitinivibrionales bacterium]
MAAAVPHHFGFYAILTNPAAGYEYCARLCVDNGIAFVQLRMKNVPKDDIARMAAKLRKITARGVTRFIVNDHPDIAAQVGADGVHVGQSDTPYADARSTVGDRSIVGISTHTPAQTREACALKPDYVGVGPVFATPTKEIRDTPIGTDGMREMLSLATVPAVVLGSITTENLPQILETGAKNFAMVRPLNQTEEPEKALREILRVYNAFVPM